MAFNSKFKLSHLLDWKLCIIDATMDFPPKTTVKICTLVTSENCDMDNIFSVAVPFLKLLKVIGLFPLSFSGHPKKCVEVFKWTDVVPSTLNLFCLLALIFGCSPMTVQLAKHSRFLLKAWTIVSAVDISSFLAMLIYQFYKRHNILRFLVLVHEFDTQAVRIGIRSNWKQQRRWVIFVLLMSVPVAIILSMYNPIVNDFFEIEQVAITTGFRYAYIFCFHVAYVLQFIFPCAAIIVRFKKLNRHIESSANAFVFHDANDICKLYHTLCDAIEIINQTVTFPFIPIFMLTLVRLFNRMKINF